MVISSSADSYLKLKQLTNLVRPLLRRMNYYSSTLPTQKNFIKLAEPCPPSWTNLEDNKRAGEREKGSLSQSCVSCAVLILNKYMNGWLPVTLDYAALIIIMRMIMPRYKHRAANNKTIIRQ